MTDRPRPDFLAPVGPEERNPWRIVAWVCAAVAAYLLTRDLMSLTAVLVLPEAARDTIRANRPLSGAYRLELEATIFGCVVLAHTVRSIAVLAFSRNLMRRPAWTFITPMRPWSFALMAQGIAAGVVLIGASAAVAWALDDLDLSPLADPSFPILDRALFAGCLLPLTLLFAVAQENLFRGVVLQTSSLISRNRIVLSLLNGALYALAAGNPTPVAMLSGFIEGAALSWSVLSLAGIEFAVGFQFISTWLSLLIGPLITTDAVKPLKWTVSWQVGLEIVVEAAVLAGLLWCAWRVNRRRLNL